MQPRLAVAAAFAMACLGVAWLQWPHEGKVLAAVTSDLSQRDVGQRANIERAAQALDGIEIKAGQQFSFNATVGPRTVARGYREATALMEGNRVTSVGGGICQVSSTVYGAAKRAGCRIVRRVPHRGHVSSVPPGEDATVWYGGADLVWEAAHRVHLKATILGDKLIVSLIDG